MGGYGLGVRIAVALSLSLALVLPARAEFPSDPPNDPDYAGSEGDPALCATRSALDQEWYLFSFIPQCAAPTATDPEGASGMSVDRVWRDYTIGRPDVLVAYVEGGVNWHGEGLIDLVNKVYVNWRELPVPCTAAPCTTRFASSESSYDRNHDGVVNAADWALDPRVGDRNGNGLIDPEDLIAAFSDGIDQDANGFVDDISGWDFYDGQNDPATVDSSYGHSDGEMRNAAAETNNGYGSAGICPRCMLLPVKAGAEALDRTTDLAQAWLFAANTGASVVLSTTADLGYSPFMRQVVEELWRRGVVMVESSNDFDSTDHQGGMFWPHVLPGNSIVSNADGVAGPAANALIHTFRSRSDYSSWGTHHFFSVPTQGGSTSNATPTVGAAAALVLSYGRDAAKQGRIARPLTGPEAVQVLRATASRIDDPTLPWPGTPGEWNLQYGYGRPNVLRAVEAVHDGDVPPVAWIETPDWYALFDPTREGSVAVSGHVEATRSKQFSWRLEWALGAEPDDSAFQVAGTGSGHEPFDGNLGAVDLTRIPESFWSAPYRESKTKTLEATEQYTITLRLSVTDDHGRVGEDRRTIAVHHDPTWWPGFPMRVEGALGIESEPVLADLTGTGHLALVFGDDAGRVHALDPLSRSELPGWPALTDPIVWLAPDPSIDAGHEPVGVPVAIGDLDHDGHPWVVATTLNGTVYVFDSHGARRPGWPRALDAGVVPPPIPRPALPHARLPARGAASPPVLFDIDGDGQLDIVQTAWDGHIHVWRADGTDLPGWPVRVALPDSVHVDPPYMFIHDEKLQSAPAIADLDGDGVPEIVVRSQVSAERNDGIAPLTQIWVHAYHADGSPVAGWPVRLFASFESYGTAQEPITEGTDSPIAADIDGDGKDEISISPIFSPPQILRGDGSLFSSSGSEFALLLSLLPALSDPISVVRDGLMLPSLAMSFTTSGAFGRLGDRLVVAQPASGSGSLATALELSGTGRGIVNLEQAYDAASGKALSGFPVPIQGLAFLSAPLIADVSGDGVADVIEATDSSALSAHRGSGDTVSGFPRFTSGWTVWSPTAGDVDGDGKVELTASTREGYLFLWKTSGQSAANHEWWTFRHDEHRTARYGTDSRPPGIVRDVSWQPLFGRVSFVAPGDDGFVGKVAGYRVRAGDGAKSYQLPATVAAGQRETFSVPFWVTSLTIQAVDAAGNLSWPVTVKRP